MERFESIAAQNRTFRRARLLAGSLGVQMDKRIQLRLQPLDAFKMEFDDFDGRDSLGSNFLADFRQGAIGEEAHGLMSESKRTPGAGQGRRRKAQLGAHKNG